MSYTSGAAFQVLTPNASQTGVINVTLPNATNPLPQAISHDLNFAVYGNTLHTFAMDNGTAYYAPLLGLPTADRYIIKNRGRKVVIASANSSSVAPGILSSNYTFQVLDISQGRSKAMMGNFSIEGAIEQASGAGL